MEDESGPSAKPVAGGLAGPAALHVTTAPNPFNSSTTLFLHLPTAGPVTLTVYNTAGQVVARLVPGIWLDAGPHVREWDGRDDHGRAAASGLYLYRLIAAEEVRVGKIALIRELSPRLGRAARGTRRKGPTFPRSTSPWRPVTRKVRCTGSCWTSRTRTGLRRCGFRRGWSGTMCRMATTP